MLFRVKRPLIDEKPVVIFRLRAVFYHVLPRYELFPAVIEHCVQHNADSHVMRFFHEGF